MKGVLLVTIGFSPNVGGIETHFDNLVKALDKRNWKVWVLTYKPITTKVGARFYEKRGRNIKIYRIPWFRHLFYLLINNPALEFLYLIPGLFLALPIFLIFKGKDISVIHSHGLAAGFVSDFWGKVFGKRVIATTHSIYNFPSHGLYRRLAKWIFGQSDKVLTLSKQSKKEIEKLGINKNKINVFTYWIDLSLFKRVENAKKRLGWDKNFVILFVGRFISEKGIRELLDTAEIWNKNIYLAMAGSGPLEAEIKKQKSKNKNINFLGRIENDKLPPYYSAADLVIVPSIHEEGFGRVILESLACGTPVIGARRGAIPEAMNESVGRLIKVTPKNIKQTVEYLYKNRNELEKLSKNARKFALKRYSEKNSETIVGTYISVNER